MENGETETRKHAKNGGKMGGIRRKMGKNGGKKEKRISVGPPVDDGAHAMHRSTMDITDRVVKSRRSLIHDIVMHMSSLFGRYESMIWL